MYANGLLYDYNENSLNWLILKANLYLFWIPARGESPTWK